MFWGMDGGEGGEAGWKPWYHGGFSQKCDTDVAQSKQWLDILDQSVWDMRDQPTKQSINQSLDRSIYRSIYVFSQSIKPINVSMCSEVLGSSFCCPKHRCWHELLRRWQRERNVQSFTLVHHTPCMRIWVSKSSIHNIRIYTQYIYIELYFKVYYHGGT